MKTQDELKALHGSDYVEAFITQQSPFRLGRLLARIALSKDQHIVDFGCGNGMLMEYLAPRVMSYTGVDFSEPFIGAARQKQLALGITNATFSCEDIEVFTEQHQRHFDSAFAMDFSEHVYDKEWVAILANIRQSLKPGGLLYLHTPNRNFIVELMKHHNIILKQFPEHIAVRTPQENARLLRLAGFTSIKTSLIAHYNILKLLHVFSYLPWVGKFFKARIFIQAQA